MRALLAGAGVLALGGCRYYSPERGAAYLPWQFPGTDERGPLALVHAALLAANPHNRMHLWATSVGLAMQPLNQLAERRDRELVERLAPVAGARLATLVPPGRAAQMLFRVGYAQGQPHHSPRRPVAWVVASSIAAR